jgi:hypothetical protein
MKAGKPKPQQKTEVVTLVSLTSVTPPPQPEPVEFIPGAPAVVVSAPNLIAPADVVERWPIPEKPPSGALAQVARVGVTASVLAFPGRYRWPTTLIQLT